MEDPRPDDIEELLDELEKEYGTESSQAQPYLDQAYAHEARDEFEEALRECDLAIELAPDRAEAHNLRGIVLEELGRSGEAIAAYREAIRLDPAFQDAAQNLQELAEELEKAGPDSPLAEGKRFGIRAGAYIIDTITYFLLTNLTTFVVAVFLGVVLTLTGRPFYLDEQTPPCLGYIIGLVLFALYFAVFEWLYGASLGKLLLRMRVVMASGEGCTLGAALIRAGLRYIDGFFFALPAYASMKPPLYQRIGDKSAQTVVVDSRDPGIRQRRAGWWFLVALLVYLAIDAVGSLGLLVATMQISPPPSFPVSAREPILTLQKGMSLSPPYDAGDHFDLQPAVDSHPVTAIEGMLPLEPGTLRSAERPGIDLPPRLMKAGPLPTLDERGIPDHRARSRRLGGVLRCRQRLSPRDGLRALAQI